MDDRAPLGYRFEEFSFLIDKRLLVKDDGVRIRLRAKPFKTLLVLLQNAPGPVTRDQFASSVWQKTAVEDSNLTVQIVVLRKALGDPATESRYIETIPKEGYRFIPAVKPIESLGSNGRDRAKPLRHSHSAEPSNDHSRPRRAPRGKKAAGAGKGWLPISACVPAALVSLIGREREVRELSALLSGPGVRLVTLVGAGGSGKTELAQQTAAGAAEHFPDGIIFVSLASITHPGLVGSAIAQSLGVRESGTQSLDDTLARSLRRRKLLLLLDNFEHLISAAEFVVWLLRMCPRLTVLVTSRAPLRVSGEHVYAVEPLPLPDLKKKSTVKALADCPSVALFVERAAAARSDFKLTDENAAAVAEICRTTGGLPLAIELAAAQAGLLSVNEMLAGSERRRLDLLRAGRRDAPNRQQTMRKNIEWSYQLLSVEEQRLFARLSVFVGGFTRDAAEGVCGRPEAANSGIVQALTSLLENRIITLERSAKSGLEPRLNMLEVIREYAADRLSASGDRDTLHQRHAEFFCEFAEAVEPRLVGRESRMALDAVHADLGNVRDALSWCVRSGSVETGLKLAAALRAFWFRRGLISEGARWLDNLMAGEVQVSAIVRAKALTALGLLINWQGDPHRAVNLLETGLRVYRRGDDQEGLADTLRFLGEAATRQGDISKANVYLSESLYIYRQRGHQLGVGAVQGALGHLAYMLGDTERALELDRGALDLIRESGDESWIAHRLNNIGHLLILKADYDGATGCLRESLAAADRVEDDVRRREALESVAFLAYKCEVLVEAASIVGALDIWEQFPASWREQHIQRDCDEILQAAAAALKPEELAACIRMGAEMSLEELVGYAFDYLDQAGLGCVIDSGQIAAVG